MTELACLRGRIVVVAIHPEPPPVRLFDFFWKELTMVGARVYEPADYEAAIALLAAGDALPRSSRHRGRAARSAARSVRDVAEPSRTR